MTETERDANLGGARRSSTQRALGGFAWASVGIGAQAVGQLAVLAVLGRVLRPDDFGVVQATLVMVSLGRVITQSVISHALVRQARLSDGHVRAAFWLAQSVGVAAAALFFLAAPLAADLFQIPRMESATRVLAAGFLIQALGVVPLGLLERNLRFKRIAQAEVISFMVGYVAVGLTLGLLGAGYWSLVIAALAQVTLHAVVLAVSVRYDMRLRVDRTELGEIVRTATGFAGHRTFHYIAMQGDYMVVARTLGETALGIYGRAYQLLQMPAMLFGQIVDRVLFPTVAAIQDDRPRVARQYLRAVSLTVSFSAPVSVLVVIAAPEVVGVVLGGQWDAAIGPLRILGVGLVARTAYKISDTLSRAIAEPFARARRQFIYAAMVIGGAAIAQRWGIEAVAVAVTIAIIVNHLMMAQLCLRAVGQRPWRFVMAHLRPLGPALVGLAGALPTAILLRQGGLADPMILLGTVAAAAAAILLASIPFGRLLWDADTRWLRTELKTFVRHR